MLLLIRLSWFWWLIRCLLFWLWWVSLVLLVWVSCCSGWVCLRWLCIVFCRCLKVLVMWCRKVILIDIGWLFVCLSLVLRCWKMLILFVRLILRCGVLVSLCVRLFIWVCLMKMLLFIFIRLMLIMVCVCSCVLVGVICCIVWLLVRCCWYICCWKRCVRCCWRWSLRSLCRRCLFLLRLCWVFCCVCVSKVLVKIMKSRKMVCCVLLCWCLIVLIVWLWGCWFCFWLCVVVLILKCIMLCCCSRLVWLFFCVWVIILFFIEGVVGLVSLFYFLCCFLYLSLCV